MEIVVVSGKGGTGKSSISAAFASLAGHTVVADCDVDAANLYLIFETETKEIKEYPGGKKAKAIQAKCTRCGLCTDYCRFDAIHPGSNGIEINEIFCEGCGLCCSVCPSSALILEDGEPNKLIYGKIRYGHLVYGLLPPGGENSGKLVSLVREKASVLAHNENIRIRITDGPPGTGCPVISTVTGAGKVVIVTEPTMAGYLDFQRVADLVAAFGYSPYVIINKNDINAEMAAKIRENCRERELVVAGEIPQSNAFTQAMKNKLTVMEINANETLKKRIQSIFKTITDDF